MGLSMERQMITLMDVILGGGVYLGLNLTVAIINRLISRLQDRRGHVRWLCSDGVISTRSKRVPLRPAG